MPHIRKDSNLAKPEKEANHKYKVKKLSLYNQSLRKMINLYFSAGNTKKQFINDTPYVKGESGQSLTYTPAYIETIYMLCRLFAWGQSQIAGYYEDLWNLFGRCNALETE